MTLVSHVSDFLSSSPLKYVLRSSFLKNVGGTFVRQVASGLLSLATVVLIARLLGPSGSGAYAVALLLPSLLATFLNLGVSAANVYFLASRKVDLRTAFVVTSYLSLFCTLGGLVVGAGIVSFFGAVAFPGVAIGTLALALAAFPFMLMLGAAGGLLQGLQDFRAYNLTLLVPPLVTLMGAGALAALGRLDIFSVMMCYLIGQVCGAAWTTASLLRRIEWNQQLAVHSRRRYLAEILGYGLKAYASNIVTFFNYRADLFLVNFFLGPSASGIYVIAMQFGEKLWLLSQAISTVFLPRISALANDEDQRKRITPLVARWALLLTLLAAVVLVIVFDPAVKLLIGDEFSAATWILLLLLPGIVAWAPARILANDIAGRGKPEVNLGIAVLVMLSNIVGNIALIPILGISGAALSTSFSYLLMLVLTYFKFTG